MLKIHDLYGQSFAHEFQFTNPDSIKNAVKRYNLQRAAERDEYNRDKDTHKMNKLRFCKMRNSGNDVLSMVTSRDLDVETQMSLDIKESKSASSLSISSRKCSRSDSSQSWNGFGSDQEIAAPAAERLAGGADTVRPRGKARSKIMRARKQKRGTTKQKQVTTAPKVNMDDDYAAHIAGLHREVCAELQDIAPAELQGRNPNRRQAKPRHSQKKKRVQQQPIQKAKPKPCQKSKPNPNAHPNPNPPPAPEKIVPEQFEQDKIMQRLKQVLSVNDQMQLDSNQMSYPDYGANESQWQDVIPTPMLPQMMNAELCRALNTTPSMACLFMQQHGLPCGMEAEPPYVDDSDLEQEIVDRPGYMRYIERLPYNPSETLDTRSSQNACFEELEPHPHWTRLQRSLKPMHYTSQRSDTDTLTLCDTLDREEPQKAEKTEKTDAGKAGQVATKRQKTAPPHPTKRRPVKRKLPAQEEAPKAAYQPAETLLPNMPPIPVITTPNLNMQRRRKNTGRNVVCTRSLENLKYEKMTIYNKISYTQERIITALDRLQGKLLQLQMPTCSNQEKQRRERNAFKFCVTFSRNYLYPLRGLIEDVRATPVASFNSATSNEASQRVVCVYSLMHHSIGNYKRQLRYFLLDKVPQKLSALIEMMYTLTNVCLDKGVLDRQDPVVECLQQRCTSFLTFIEDMQQERFQLARETYRRLQKRAHQAHGTGRSGTRERYDLKMFLNDLKLYEPRLVPKERPEKRRPRGWIRRPKQEKTTINAQSQTGVVAIEPPAEKLKVDPDEEVPTHIECVQCGDYRCDPSSDYLDPSSDQKDQLTNILALLQQPRQEKRELHQQLLEAMEHVTKSQVREVLDPLVRSLGAILDKKMGDHFN